MRCFTLSGRAIIISRTPSLTKSMTPIVALPLVYAPRPSARESRQVSDGARLDVTPSRIITFLAPRHALSSGAARSSPDRKNMASGSEFCLPYSIRPGSLRPRCGSSTSRRRCPCGRWRRRCLAWTEAARGAQRRRPSVASAKRSLAATATETLHKLPPALVGGALVPQLHTGVLDVIAPLYAKDAAMMEKFLRSRSSRSPRSRTSRGSPPRWCASSSPRTKSGCSPTAR